MPCEYKGAGVVWWQSPLPPQMPAPWRIALQYRRMGLSGSLLSQLVTSLNRRAGVSNAQPTAPRTRPLNVMGRRARKPRKSVCTLGTAVPARPFALMLPLPFVVWEDPRWSRATTTLRYPLVYPSTPSPATLAVECSCIDFVSFLRGRPQHLIMMRTLFGAVTRCGYSMLAGRAIPASIQ
ncbi:hypothetical protein C2E23DRAFT_448662 [Lenzites betulinus]|nr:hypothetical protein C2E23DRAFT_448662 [Lenzites betulinus]